jgi:hypothetical protein
VWFKHGAPASNGSPEFKHNIAKNENKNPQNKQTNKKPHHLQQKQNHKYFPPIKSLGLPIHVHGEVFLEDTVVHLNKGL